MTDISAGHRRRPLRKPWVSEAEQNPPLRPEAPAPVSYCSRTTTSREGWRSLANRAVHNSSVRRILNAGGAFYRGFALEGLVPFEEMASEPLAEFFFGYVKNGYGWLFPKGNHVNVGIYTWDSSVKLSKGEAASVCD